MPFRIEYKPSVVSEDIPLLSKAVRERIRKEIERKLVTFPVEFGKPLQYTLSGARRLRVGDYRVVFVIRGDSVLILKIGHRREVYDE